MSVNLIKVESKGGNPVVSINPLNVTRVDPSIDDDGVIGEVTIITLADHDTIEVAEPYDTVTQAVEDALNGRLLNILTDPYE